MFTNDRLSFSGSLAVRLGYDSEVLAAVSERLARAHARRLNWQARANGCDAAVLVRHHLAEFLEHVEEGSHAPLPDFVRDELRGFAVCGDFSQGFVRTATLRLRPHGRRRMTRGHCGSLLLQCEALSSFPFCRSAGPMEDPRERIGAGDDLEHLHPPPALQAGGHVDPEDPR